MCFVLRFLFGIQRVCQVTALKRFASVKWRNRSDSAEHQCAEVSVFLQVMSYSSSTAQGGGGGSFRMGNL